MKSELSDQIVHKLMELASMSEGHHLPILDGEDEVFNKVIRVVNDIIDRQIDSRAELVKKQNERIKEFQNVLNAYLRKDFSVKAHISESKDDLDALALGVNYFGVELEALFRLNESFTQELETKVRERTKELEESQENLRKSLTKEKELVKMKNQFVADASHQFRTPLTVIQANAGLVLKMLETNNETNTPGIKKACGKIVSEVGSMTEMMHDVLLLSQYNSGNISSNFKTIDLWTILNGLVQDFNSIQTEERQVSLRCIGKRFDMELDQKLIKHALSNLIANALKYSQGKRAPEISIIYQKSVVRVKILDFGIGIPETFLPQLFQPFYRGNNVGNIPGTGLGLSIVENYVSINKGTIDVKSELGKGTEVIVSFRKA